MAYFNFKTFFRRKVKQAKAAYAWKQKKKDDTIDMGNDKSLKFDGKRWRKVDSSDDLEVAKTDRIDEDSDTTLVTAKAVKTLGDSTDTKLALKANKNMDNVAALPASVVETLKGADGATGADGADSTVAGPQGSPGADGAPGSTGPQGPVGATFTMSGTTLNITT